MKPYLIAALFIAGCSGADTAPKDSPATDAIPKTGLTAMTANFNIDNVIGTPSVVDCTLSGGTKTECLSITLAAAPPSFKIGPWCPRNISGGPDVSGIWLEGGKVYDADGAFIQNMSTFYKDPKWQMFDPATGKINVTDSKVSCEAAARPDVDPQYQNHCVECDVSYLESGLSQTYVIPIMPSNAQTISPRVSAGGVGVAFSGVRLDASAPTDAILSAYTLAPFDDCGGHVNLNVGYHIHAATDCLNSAAKSTAHALQLGLAMDGYPIMTRLTRAGQEPADLDLCRGHETDGIGYHYHVNDPGANAIIGCHKGETGCTLTEANGTCDATQSARRGPPGGGDRGDRPPRGERPERGDRPPKPQ
ncbi:YHYH protein [Hellea sp.]|nr:YHYH protein [Hellea sp.]